MTFEQFDKFVIALQKFREREDKLGEMFETFNSSYTIIDFCPEIANCIMNYIKDYFEDHEEWFSYWVYELSYGKDYTENSCFYKTGDPIVIKTSLDLYNFLIKNKEKDNSEEQLSLDL